MSSRPEDFDTLKQLLICKRYEQPPPGYFESFPDRVLERLEAEEFSEYSSWWQWVVDKFDAKPIVACVYGMAVSGLLLAGFRLSQIFESDGASAPIVPWLATTPASTSLFPHELGHNPLMDSTPSSFSVSVNPVFKAESHHLLFGGNQLRLQPVSYTFSE